MGQSLELGLAILLGVLHTLAMRLAVARAAGLVLGGCSPPPGPAGHGDAVRLTVMGWGQHGRLFVLWGCQSAAQRLAQLDTVPRVGQPQAISTTLTGQDAAHSVPSVTSQMKVFTPWFLGATMSLPRAPAPPGLPGLSPLQLGPAGGTGPGSLAGLGPGERGAQGASTTGMAPVGPHARHRPGAGGGKEAEPPSIIHLRVYRGKCV